MRRVLGGLVAMGLLATGACSGDEPNPAPTDLSTPDSTSAASSPESTNASGSATGQSSATAECLRHRYRLLRFIAIGGAETYGTGKGGDVHVTFTNQTATDGGRAEQSYLLEGRGQDPIRLTLAGTTGQLTVDGTIQGTYELRGSQATFTPTASEGSATLKAGGRTEKLTMTEVAAIAAPRGSAAVACTDNTLTLTAQSVRFEFDRV
jgi:hypothetical protein